MWVRVLFLPHNYVTCYPLPGWKQFLLDPGHALAGDAHDPAIVTGCQAVLSCTQQQAQDARPELRAMEF